MQSVVLHRTGYYKMFYQTMLIFKVIVVILSVAMLIVVAPVSENSLSFVFLILIKIKA